MRIVHARERMISTYIALLVISQASACIGNETGFEATQSTYSSNANVNRPATQVEPAVDANTTNGNTTNGNTTGTNANSTNLGGQTGGNANNQSLIAVPLKGCFASDYTARVRLGDGSSYQLIVDTGSTTLAVAASACTNCAGISPSYTPSAKATDDQTSTSGQYGDGSSWSGEVFTDVVSMGSANDVRMAFATIDRQSMSRTSGRNFFNASYCSGSAVSDASQGIIGFAGKKLALPHTDAYLTGLQTTNTLPDVVAAQFCDLDGNLWLGGYDPGSVSVAPIYTPMSVATGFYEVTMQDMLLDGVPVGTSSSYGTAIVDTGTSIMIVTTSLFDALNTALDNNPQFVAYFGPGFLANGSCSVPATAVTRAALDAALPKLVLEFPDAQGNMQQVRMAATDSYLMAMKQPGGTIGYCAAVSSGGGTGGLPNLLLGNSLMHSQITIFDRANSRLGLAPQVGCNRL